jgi:hypothetical protein
MQAGIDSDASDSAAGLTNKKHPWMQGGTEGGPASDAGVRWGDILVGDRMPGMLRQLRAEQGRHEGEDSGCYGKDRIMAGQVGSPQEPATRPDPALDCRIEPRASDELEQTTR